MLARCMEPGAETKAGWTLAKPPLNSSGVETHRCAGSWDQQPGPHGPFPARRGSKANVRAVPKGRDTSSICRDVARRRGVTTAGEV